MGYNSGDEQVEFEARIEHSTAKAKLLVPTMGPEQCWCPNSVIDWMSEPDEYGNRTFRVRSWWAKKAGVG